MNKELFYQDLISWYDQSKRILPWRDNPNPYHVWVSEIMLQQTRVETVTPYFNRFIRRLPTIESLSKVNDDELNKLWEGLGYYSRVRNLKKAAIDIVSNHNGMLPNEKKELESLSGIGSYTSGAILSIAFNKPYTAVDGNVLRVFARLLGIIENIKEPQIKETIKKEVETVLPNTRVGDFNQGLMEIGATVCLPNGKPICSVCPFNKYCVAYNKGLVDVIPAKQVKKKKKEEQVTVFVLKNKGKIAIERRPSTGLLAGLYQFPNEFGSFTKEDVMTKFKSDSVKPLSNAKHVFTHIIWHLQAYEINVLEQDESYIWATKQELLDKYSIPTAFKEYKKYVLKE